MNKLTYCIIISLLSLLALPSFVYAHGVEIEYNTEKSFKIAASYDNGEPIAEAQVNVFAPNNPAEPWLQGKTDENGRFLFTPDFSQNGTWNVQVRKAGHGGMIPIEVNEGVIQATVNSGYTTMQLVIMIAAVIWGFIGTALYFKRKPS
ncbi:FixH family protein [Calidifontibacillus oryziterrae]|uniref:FixH family protein n=1 Tax=Calidifontibacillus oryziterrae TaxID=1191699 RepID=UPI0002EC1EB7|nr:FixH family protein [Calidifontibacillus oryziterrae]